MRKHASTSIACILPPAIKTFNCNEKTESSRPECKLSGDGIILIETKEGTPTILFIQTSTDVKSSFANGMLIASFEALIVDEVVEDEETEEGEEVVL